MAWLQSRRQPREGDAIAARRPAAATVLAVAALLVALAGSGIAQPVAGAAAGAGKTLERALGLGKRADRRAGRAVKLARRADRNASSALRKSGPQGARGATGAAGAAGPPGPTASRQVDDAPTNDLAGTETILDLATTETTDRQITTAFDGRIVASATVELSTQSATASAGDCSLRISDGTGPGNGLTDISQIYNFDFPATSNYDLTVHLTGAAEKPAGTYNVQLRCSEANGDISADKAEMVVFAVAS